MQRYISSAKGPPVTTVKPLPDYLLRRYHGWKATTFDNNRGWYRNLAEQGQHPRAMVISCCDSRVQPTSIFDAEGGELFVHRNVANLVPPCTDDRNHHGTSAAVEYAVTSLKVAHLVVMGHSACGGVKGCYDMCEGKAPQLEEQSSFVGRWMDILRPGHAALSEGTDEERVAELEKGAIRVSMRNLMTFPFVAEAVERGDLTLHGLWTDIASGQLLALDEATDTFLPV